MRVGKAYWSCVWCAVLFLLLAPQCAYACTCRPMGIAESKRDADVVFAGTVTGVDVVDTETNWEPRIVVTFSVARVWKGAVGQTFQMHTSYEASSCGGFPREMAQPGSTLLVYGYANKAKNWKQNLWAAPSNAGSASLVGDAPAGVNKALLNAVKEETTVYTTSICSRTTGIEYAAEDIAGLGAYTELAPLKSEPSIAFLESLRPIANGVPEECVPFTDARRWSPVRDPSKMAELVAVLEQGSGYRHIPMPRPVQYDDYWVVNAESHVGMCRVSQNPEIVCGEATVEFIRIDNRWETGESSVRTYCK